jgi:hypothetical protein
MAAAGRIHFHEYFTQEENPYPNPGDLLHLFRADPLITPASLLSEADSTRGYPLAFLLASSQHVPELAIMPFSFGLPGITNNKLALLSDMSSSGQSPDMIAVENLWFHLSGQVPVPTNDEMVNQWTANPAVQLLPPPLAGNGVGQAQSRKCVPLPHEYATMMILAKEQGTLTWRWLWTNVGEPIRLDPTQQLAYATFLDFLRVASTQRSPAAVGGIALDPAPEVAIIVARASATVKDRAIRLATTFLPGLGSLGGLGMQLNLMQGQMNQQQQLLLTQQAQANTPASIFRKNPQRHQQVSRICEVPNESDFAAFWAVYPAMRPGEWLGALESTCTTIAAELGASPPILSPSLATDIGGGKFTAYNANHVTQGLSPFRIATHLNTNSAERRRRNMVYGFVGLGTGVAQADAVTMVLANNEIEVPNNSGQFRALLEGYYVLLLAVLGEHSRVVVNYKAHVYDQSHSLQHSLDSAFVDERELRGAYLIVLTHIWRCTNEHLSGCLRGQVGLVDPAYDDVARELMRGRLRFLTEVPPDVLKQQEPSQRQGRQQAEGDGAPLGVEQARNRVEHPNQNVNLRNAWAATQHPRIFGPTSPFYDAAARNHHKILNSDTPGVRICLAMALKGTCYDNCTGKHEQLSDAEVQRVARVGNFTVP